LDFTSVRKKHQTCEELTSIASPNFP
jgi:hypothetical protein